MKKKLFLVAIATLFVTVPLCAQNASNAQQKSSMNKMRAEKIAFIEQKVNFTDKEKADFIPFYEEYEKKKMEMNQQCRPDNMCCAKNAEKPGSLTEKEIEEMMDKCSENRFKKAQLERDYYEQSKKILSPSKLMKVYQAERDYRMHLLKEIKGGKGGKGGKGKPQGRGNIENTGCAQQCMN